MSVVTRRRKLRVSGDSEEFSEDSYDDNEANKGSEGDIDLNASSEGLRESEYETLDEAGESESEGTTAVVDEREGELSDSVIIEYEREEGDGQESVPLKEKKLDDDEDRRNPQYIPKRGTFYEHDDRTAVEDINKEIVEKETERNKENEKKKVWKEHENRWSHDRYNEEDQTPKSRDELIAIYGYDIRNEDAPPRARRRRKYGRGPNKYTRNWEDEDAYGKSGAVVSRGSGAGRRGGRGSPRKPFGIQTCDSEEEFPPLDNSGQSGRGHKIDGVPSRSGPIPVSQMRGSYRGGRGAGGSESCGISSGGAFLPLPRSSDHGSEIKENSSKEDKMFSNMSGCSHATNPWKKDNNQNKMNVTKHREDSQKPIKDITKNAVVNASGNVHINSFAKSRTTTDEKKVKVEENGWKTRRDRSGPRTVPEDIAVADSNSSWRSKSKGDRRGMQGIPVESQTFTPSAPRGRGRGQRGGGPGRQALEFKLSSNSASTESSRRSLSETRMSSHEKDNNSEGPYIKSQVVNRTTDDMTKELKHLNVSENLTHLNNRDYSKKPTKSNPNYHQVPPRMQESAANKPKRYSSQRQRSLPESGAAAAAAAAAASYVQPHGYYSPAGYAQPPEELEGMGVVSSGYAQPPPVYGEAQSQPPPPAVVAQPPATTPPLGMLPPPHPPAQAYAAPPFSSPPTFIPPPVAGPPPPILPPGAATYMAAAPTGTPILNYVATAAQNQFAPQAFAPFQGYSAVPATQPPPELYQPQGITYYSPEEQVMSRPITQKRQSTAIPIVPPPEKGPRGRGRLREESTRVPGTPVGDSGAGGDAGSASPKEDQMEDAPDLKKTEFVGQACGDCPPAIDSLSETSKEMEYERVSKKTVVSPDIIDAINVTEIPESADAMEAAKSINAVEAASLVSNFVSSTTTGTIIATSTSVNETSMATMTSSASENS